MAKTDVGFREDQKNLVEIHQTKSNGRTVSLWI